MGNGKWLVAEDMAREGLTVCIVDAVVAKGVVVSKRVGRVARVVVAIVVEGVAGGKGESGGLEVDWVVLDAEVGIVVVEVAKLVVRVMAGVEVEVVADVAVESVVSVVVVVGKDGSRVDMVSKLVLF